MPQNPSVLKEGSMASSSGIWLASDGDDTVVMNKEIFDSGRFSDVSVAIEGKELKLHKNILVSSDFFFRMFSNKFQEATAGVVKLELAEGSSVAATVLAIEYIYTRNVELDGDSVMEVLAAADKLQLTKLKDHCVAFLEQHVHAENACMLYRASGQLGLSKLEEQCKEFILKHAAAVFKSEGLRHMPKEAMVDMLKGDNNLDVQEEVVFDGVVGWCEANKGEGGSVQAEFAAFLPSIRFAAMSHVFLHHRVEPSGLVSKDVLYQAALAQLDSKMVEPGGKRALEAGEESSRKTKRRRRGHVGAVTWQRMENMRGEGMELEKTGGVSRQYDAGCSSVETISRSEERQWVEWTAATNDKSYFIGLSHTDSDVHYSSIEYGLDVTNSIFSAYEEDESRGPSANCAIGDRFKVVVTGDAVTYEHNDEVFYSSTMKPSFPLLVDTSFCNLGGKVVDVRLHTV
jgi:hypothetical protein